MTRKRRTKHERKRRTPGADDPGRPPPERSQHDEIVLGDRVVFFEDGAAERTFGARVVTQRMIDRYFRHGLVDVRQHKAAEAFYSIFHDAGLEPRLVPNLLRSGGGVNTYGMPANEHQAMTREAYRPALKAIPRRLRDFAINVICLDMPASESVAGRGDKAAKIAGLTTLRIVLDVLADHLDIADANTLSRARS